LTKHDLAACALFRAPIARYAPSPLDEPPPRRRGQNDIEALPGLKRPLISLRVNGNLLNNFRLIWVIQPAAKKYSAFHPTQISGYFRAVPSRQEGRIARRHERGTGCGGRSSVRREASSQGGFSRERTRRARWPALQRTAKPCGSGTRGWCQAVGGEFGPTGSVAPSSRQRWRQKEFVSRESAA